MEASQARDPQQKNDEKLLLAARAGDIKAFHQLFVQFQPQLKSYLYRLTSNRNDTEDLAQDAFIMAFDGLPTFKGASSLKTWVFTIATNHALRQIKKRRRWYEDTHERVKETAHANPHLLRALDKTNATDPQGAFEIREHINYCFTCTSNMLPVEQQVSLLLKDVYQFKIDEIACIMSRSRGSIKHLVHKARQTMMRIFDDQCALVNKRGACNQCSQLNGRFNPKQDTQAKLRNIDLSKEASTDQTTLYKLRAKLASTINPLDNVSSSLHDVFFSLAKEVNKG